MNDFKDKVVSLGIVNGNEYIGTLIEINEDSVVLKNPRVFITDSDMQEGYFLPGLSPTVDVYTKTATVFKSAITFICETSAVMFDNYNQTIDTVESPSAKKIVKPRRVTKK